LENIIFLLEYIDEVFLLYIIIENYLDHEFIQFESIIAEIISIFEQGMTYLRIILLEILMK